MSRAILCAILAFSGGAVFAEPNHDGEPFRPATFPPRIIKSYLATHDKAGGNSDVTNAEIFVLCLGAKNDELIANHTKDGDVILKGLLPPLPRQGGGEANPGASLSTFLDENRERFVRASSQPALAQGFFRSLEAKVATLEASTKKDEASACTTEEALAGKILKGLTSARTGRVFAEVYCARWNASAVLRQLVKPYRHIVVGEKTWPGQIPNNTSARTSL